MSVARPLYVCFVLVLLGAAAPAGLRAQEAGDEDRPEGAWDADLVGKLSASQAGYRNWTEGGINTLAATAGISGRAERTTNGWQQTHDGRLALGVVKQDTLAFRKADDLIRLTSALQYNGDGFFRVFNPTVAVSVRTQFAAGFNYDKNPFDTPHELPVKVSDFFSPATFTHSLGLTYDPVAWFTQRVGVAGKETVVAIERLRTLYGLAPDQAVRFELGVESRTELDRELFDNVRLTSTLGLFAAFNQQDVPDMLWENLVVMQVNQWLGVNFELDMLFDRDISDALQVKEVLSLGVSVALL